MNKKIQTLNSRNSVKLKKKKKKKPYRSFSTTTQNEIQHASQGDPTQTYLSSITLTCYPLISQSKNQTQPIQFQLQIQFNSIRNSPTPLNKEQSQQFETWDSDKKKSLLYLWKNQSNLHRNQAFYLGLVLIQRHVYTKTVTPTALKALYLSQRGVGGAIEGKPTTQKAILIADSTCKCFKFWSFTKKSHKTHREINK